ncbi:MAG: recombinase family protein [Clostridia bacterium]|nr:recombinase family protein [Clostridia bacterium]
MSAIEVHMARTSKYQTYDTVFAPSFEWNAGLYIRLSREDGDKLESESVGTQKAILERFVAEHPAINLYDYYIDDGWSGTDFERPAFQRMLADITTKKINCVIVKDLSRFGRNYVEAGKYLETVFPLFKIRFISVNDMIDGTENPSSVNNIIVPFKNIINDEYCRDISMKVRSALDIRRRQGKFIGSFAAYGYKKDETDHNKLIIDEPAAEIVRSIYEKFIGGNSILGIARELNERKVPNPTAYKKLHRGSGLWNDSTVRRILTNELYIGNLVQKKNEVISYKIHVSKAVESKNRIVVENTHKPIISKSDFYKVQSLLKRDTRISPNKGKLSVLSGFIKCADCGRAMQKRTVKQGTKIYEYYVCSSYKKNHLCTKHAIRAKVLEEAVLSFLNRYIKLAVNFDRLADKINKELKNSDRTKRLNALIIAKRQELDKANKILVDIYPDYKSGLIGREQYLALKEKYETLAMKSEEEIKRIESEVKTFEIEGFAKEFVSAFKKYDGVEKLTRDIVVELIENILIHESGEIEIRLKCRNVLNLSELLEKYERKPTGATESA